MNYVVLRKDRAGDVGWGGVLLAVHDWYDKELLFGLTTWKNDKLLVCAVYLPPNCNDNQYLDVLTCMENAITMYSRYKCIVIGDFNLKLCSSEARNKFNNFLKYS